VVGRQAKPDFFICALSEKDYTLDQMMPDELTIHTVGHSDHTTAAFVDLLQRHGITLVIDVRSHPYSRWANQFNREVLARDLEDSDTGIGYLFLGDALGGRPASPKLYDPGQDRPDYQRVAQTGVYRAGIERLLALARAERVVLMCSEGDHRRCHRHLLITQTLLDRGVRTVHIQPDGSTVEGERVAQQLSFF
jgi:uncharacterized protein (DUF488 family)